MLSTKFASCKVSGQLMRLTKLLTTSLQTRRRLPLLLALALTALTGCATAPLGETARLLRTYPAEAKAAAQIAPNFTRDALKTINRLEANQKEGTP